MIYADTGDPEGAAMTERPLYSSRIIDTFIKYIEQRYPHIDTNEILSNSGIKPYQVADQGHWFTQEEVTGSMKKS